MIQNLRETMEQDPYRGYTYAYPHKSAYRPLEEPQALDAVWREEDLQRLFLYLHVPFCEFRCGFCNLFTIAQPRSGIADDFLLQLEIEAEAVRRAVPEAQYAQVAIGGGTPTFLDRLQLERLLTLVGSLTNADSLPTSCEASPATIDPEKLKLLQDAGISRLSLGIQSFDPREAKDLGRPQAQDEVSRALDLLTEFPFPVRNLDLIYGVENQALESWMDSVNHALAFRPEELFLYPLYVRQLTGLGKRQERHQTADAMAWNRQRLEAYDAARERLLGAGYVQLSMRNFLRSDVHKVSTDSGTGDYCCQNDGMIGIGCGARSYTSKLHYSSEYAVSKAGVAEILQRYLAQDRHEFSHAAYGYALDKDERKRRFLLQSLLRSEGLDCNAYWQKFGSAPMHDFEELQRLVEAGLAELSFEVLRLTECGLRLSDAIGPWLYSAAVNELSESYTWR